MPFLGARARLGSSGMIKPAQGVRISPIRQFRTNLRTLFRAVGVPRHHGSRRDRGERTPPAVRGRAPVVRNLKLKLKLIERSEHTIRGESSCRQENNS